MPIHRQQATSEEQPTADEAQLLDDREFGMLQAQLFAMICIRDSVLMVIVVGMGGHGSIQNVGVVGLEGVIMKKTMCRKSEGGRGGMREEPASKCGETRQG